MRILLILGYLIALPAHAGIWPFSDRCEDIEQIIANGEAPSKEDAIFYLKECGGEKLESLGDAAAETAEEASNRVGEIWQTIKDKAAN